MYITKSKLKILPKLSLLFITYLKKFLYLNRKKIRPN